MTDRETPRPDIDLIECIADSLLAPAGIASVLIKEDLLACIAYIRAQDARIAALEAEEQSAERRGIERAAAIIAEHRDHTSGTCLLYIEEDIHALIPGGFGAPFFPLRGGFAVSSVTATDSTRLAAGADHQRGGKA